MIQYENFIDIQKRRELVFSYLTLPSNWPKYLPTTVDVTPSINQNFNVGDRVKETLNFLGSKIYIQWTCKANDTNSFYEIEGTCNKYGGSKTLLIYEFFDHNGITRIKRVIQHRFDKFIVRIFDPLWKLYYTYEANSAFKRAKKILELMPDNCNNKET